MTIALLDAQAIAARARDSVTKEQRQLLHAADGSTRGLTLLPIYMRSVAPMVAGGLVTCDESDPNYPVISITKAGRCLLQMLAAGEPAPPPSAAHVAMLVANRDTTLVYAIRTYTVEAPGGEPNGDTEAALLALRRVLEEGRSWKDARYEFNRLAGSMADNCKALRIAAEQHFGGDFRAPVAAIGRERSGVA